VFGALLGGASVFATVMVLTRAAERQQNQEIDAERDNVPAPELAHSQSR
jgi:hypothetical protein